jgi:predicted metalloprotease with PDZ domain
MRSGFQSGERNAPQLNLARANERVGNGAYLRVYWAGAAMMLGADLRLREQTGGKQTLGSALEQLSSCCATQARRWTAQEIIARLDELTGTTVFGDLVRAQFESNGYPDYEAVMKRAGVKVEVMEVEFDAAAPWAAERDALMRPAH